MQTFSSNSLLRAPWAWARGIKVLLALAFSLQLYFVYANLHIHVLPSGEYVIHSHPRQKNSPFSDAHREHRHTSLQLLHIFQVNFGSFFLLSFGFILSFFLSAVAFLRGPLSQLFSNAPVSRGCPRAPPVCAQLISL